MINLNRKAKTKKGAGKDTKAFAFIIYVAFKKVEFFFFFFTSSIVIFSFYLPQINFQFS